MQACSISLQNIHLRIPLFAPSQRRLFNKETFANVGGKLNNVRGKVHVDALTDISFELNHGEHLALIGHNGAGKSTLLKLIGGIYPPTLGRVAVQGSIGCIFDVGAGISPEMTGLECIKFQHTLFGDPNNDWEMLAEDVAKFTELGRFLELPVRTYSNGMRARLTSAIATARRADILLIDEGIGAGDQSFQEKLSRRVHGLLESAGLLVMASHSTKLLRNYCTKGLLLEQGRVQMIGSLEEVLDRYASSRGDADLVS